MQVTTIGLDLAKNVFQVHGITNNGDVAFNRALRRAQGICDNWVEVIYDQSPLNPRVCYVSD